MMALGPGNTMLERISKIEERLKYVEDWVDTSKEFHRAMYDFTATYEANEKSREKIDSRRARIHFALLGGLITLITGCAIALFTWVLNGHHIVVMQSDKPDVASVNAKNPVI